MNENEEKKKKSVKKNNSLKEKKEVKPIKKDSPKEKKTISKKTDTLKKEQKKEVKVKEETKVLEKKENLELQNTDLNTKIEKDEVNKISENKNKKEKKEKKKGKRVVLILLGIFVILALVIVGYAFLFPFSASCDTNDKLKTKNGKLDLTLEVKANKPVLNVYYSFNPMDEDNLDLYTKVDKNGIFGSTINFKDFSIPVGKRKLCIYVESVLGVHDTSCVNVEFDMGYISEFAENNTTKISDNFTVISDELLVIFNDDVDSKEAKEIIEKHDGEIVGEIYFANMYQIRFKNSGKSFLQNAKENLDNEDKVKLVSYNNIISSGLSSVPEDSLYEGDWDYLYPSGKKWHLELIEAPAAWDLIKDPAFVNVGVIDAPIVTNHEDLQFNENNAFYLASDEFSEYKDLVSHINSSKYSKEKAHGTHVAGLIAATHNKTGVAGVGNNINLYYSNIWKYKEKFFSSDVKHYDYTGSYLYFAYALSNLVMSDCKVINMSIASYNEHNYSAYEGEDKKQLESLINFFNELFTKYNNMNKDFLFIHCAGNGHNNAGPGFDANNEYYAYLFKNTPAAKDHFINVGAISYINTDNIFKDDYDYTLRYSITSFSNYGDAVDIFAPGTNIWSAVAGTDKDKYDSMSGTSQAAPIVAGVASLVYSANPELDYKQVKEIVINSAARYISNNGQATGVVNAKEAVKMALEYKGEITKEKPSNLGYVHGIVVDAVNDKIISSGISITFENVNKKEEKYIADTDTGTYDIILPVGKYNMIISHSDYITETIYNVEITEDAITYNVKLNAVTKTSEKGVAKGTVRDAIVKDEKLPNAEIKFYRGINKTDGEPVANTVSDENGNYQIELEPGNYTAVVKAADHLESSSNVIIIPKKTKDNQDCTLTPILKEGEIRAILTWGNTPKDLDSHLVGPGLNGEKFHIYFRDKYYEPDGVYDKLDVDDTDGYGPETVSVYKGLDGTYTYYVHDYTNRNSSDSNLLGLSGAKVTLYIAGRNQPIIYNVPNKKGNLWKVFSIKNGEVTDINEMSYTNDYVNIGR